MSELERLSFTIEAPLLDRLERARVAAGYENRSEFLRDLIRAHLVERSWDDEQGDVVGTITLVYDHHKRQLGERLTSLQHEHHEEVLATTHVHLDQHTCTEVILARGKPEVLRRLADGLRSQKGVLHGEFTMTSTGQGLR